MNVDQCACCGAAIPEGRQVCKTCAVTVDKQHLYIGNTYLLRRARLRRVMRAAREKAARGAAALLAILSAFFILGAAGASDTGSVRFGAVLTIALIGLLLMGVAVWIAKEADDKRGKEGTEDDAVREKY